MITLKLVLDTLRNYFVDQRVIENQVVTAQFVDGRVTADNIDTIFPIGAYIIIDGTVFNRNVYKITASGTDYLEAAEIKAEPEKQVEIKACLIPDEVLSFVTEYENRTDLPLMKSERIGNYSYTNDKSGVEGFVIDSLRAYYNGVIV